jgi:hypothetical protein
MDCNVITHSTWGNIGDDVSLVLRLPTGGAGLYPAEGEEEEFKTRWWIKLCSLRRVCAQCSVLTHSTALCLLSRYLRVRAALISSAVGSTVFFKLLSDGSEQGEESLE